MSDIIEKFEHLKQLLPKYTIMLFDTEIEINHNKHNITVTIFLKLIRDGLLRKIKFIHDNYDYFEEMLLSNGFLQYQTTDTYIRDNLKVHIEFYSIYIDDNEGYMYESFNNIETMYDDLRKAIGINVLYKSVIKNK